MVSPDRWTAIAAAALRDRVPVHLLDEAIGAGVLRLAELHADGFIFDRPSHAGAIARNAGIDFVRDYLGREGHKQTTILESTIQGRLLDELEDELDAKIAFENMLKRFDRGAKTARQREAKRRLKMVFILLNAGYTHRQIADRLNVTESRVSQMVKRIRVCVG